MTDKKVIVITGATNGIGYDLAKWFLHDGHIVIGNGRSEERVNELNLLSENNCKFSLVDVSDSKAVETWSKDAIALYGAPDLLINNAAVGNKPNKLWEVPLEEFELIDINIKLPDLQNM